MKKLGRPCSNCPWRKDAPAEHWHPENFARIYDNCRADAMGTMLCHKATRPDGSKDQSLFCRGWVAVMGFDAIGVRLLAIRGEVTAAQVNNASRDGLYESFEDMMKANRVPTPADAGRFKLPVVSDADEGW